MLWPERNRFLVDLNLAPMRINQDAPPWLLYLARQRAGRCLAMGNVFAEPRDAPSGRGGVFALVSLGARIDLDRAANRPHAIDLIVDQRTRVEVVLGVVPRLPHSRLSHRAARRLDRWRGAQLRVAHPTDTATEESKKYRRVI